MYTHECTRNGTFLSPFKAFTHKLVNPKLILIESKPSLIYVARIYLETSPPCMVRFVRIKTDFLLHEEAVHACVYSMYEYWT